MSKPTPGPWVARPDPNGSPNDCCIGLPDDFSPIDYVAVCHVRDGALIAAAPDLLEALRVAESAFWGTCESEGQEEAIATIRAAIAKAEGVSHER